MTDDDKFLCKVATMETRVTRLHVMPPGEPTFGEMATVVEIEDEAAGEFVVVRQSRDGSRSGEVRIDRSEWPEMRAAIDRMIGECRQSRGGVA
jgi:hypothetical protein